MKRILPLILCLSMVLSLFVGCAAEDRPYVPHGSALMPEDTDVNVPIKEEKPPQELTLAFYPNRAMNPLVANDFTNRMLLSLIYQGLFAVSNKFEAVPIRPTPKPQHTHRCTVCGKTDVTNPELEFRYCSRCKGYFCYCEEHISNHNHIEE